MKKILLLSGLILFTFTACEKNLYDEELANQEKTIKDLVVPQDFDWNMTQTVTVNLTATVETPVCVYVNEKCTDEYKVIDYTIIPGMDMPVIVKVPAAINKLYVKYGDVVEDMAIVNQKVEKPLPATAAMTRGWLNGKNEVLMSAGKSWSTIMFEDLFPKLGDYDFNDFVANYRYSVEYCVSSNNQDNLNSSHVLGYEFELRVNAIGAYLPITPYLKVTAKTSDKKFREFLKGTGVSDLLITSSDPSIKVEVVSSGDGYTIYKFVGMTDKPQNEFLNTEVGKTLLAPKTIKVEAHVDNQGVKWNEAYSAEVLEFDFFITNGTDEIHKRGFEPALNLRPYPADEIENGDSPQKYSNGNNLIWALDVPAVINHGIEKGNFIHAYPQFKSWATSGGTESPFWYNSPVSSLLINYIGAFPIQ